MGTHHDTSEFACDNLYRRWCDHGREQYPKATSVLVLCDGGGSNTATRTGLKVVVNIVDRVYQTGRKYAATFKENVTIVFDDHLPKWNYTAVPTGS